MQFTDYYAAQSGMPMSSVLELTLFSFDGEKYGVITWDVSLGARPTSEQLAEIAAMPTPNPAPPTMAQLQTELVNAAISAANWITLQINKTDTHAAAFYNVSAIVAANGGSIPTTGELATSLATLSELFGGSTTALATMSQALQKASVDNLTALVVLEIASGTATTLEQLATALTYFETAINSVVSEINASIIIPITSPPPISIVGINA